MSDEPDLDAPDAPEADNAVIRGLREQVKGADAARAEADSLRRELAFTKAGIDPADARQKYFVQGYAGELTADAIRAEAEAAGFLGTATTSEPVGITPAERAAFEASAAAAGGNQNDPVAVDPFVDLRGINPLRSGITPDQFAQQVAQRVRAAGGPTADNGPQGRIESRSNTPQS